MQDIAQIREEIDRIDSAIIDLFRQRMEVSDDVARYKQAHGLPVLDKGRERAKIHAVSQAAPPELSRYAAVLFGLLMEMSKARQTSTLGVNSALYETVVAARRATPELFPRDCLVACQGVEGAYSQLACDRAFRHPLITYHKSFAGVFRAVEEGEAAYGVLPLENSTAGTVSKVYDLMMENNFYIVRTVRLKVDHNLMAKPGTRIEDIHDIYSHEQAIAQCRGYLASPLLHNAEVHVRPNTALAAQEVANSERSDVAALCSRSCADLYGLVPLQERVQDQSSNFTRFACISKNLEVYPGADRTSFMMTVSHEPGSLYKILARIYALDINLVKLESRPIPDRDFEFMFYFDLECPVAAPEFADLLNALDEISEGYRYLGSYTEQL